MPLSRRHQRRLVSKYRAGRAIVELSTDFGLTVGQVRGILEVAGEELPAGDEDRGGLVGVFGSGS